MGFYYAGVAGQVQLGLIELELGGYEAALGGFESGLGLNDWEVIVHAGCEAVASIGEGLGGEVHIAARYFDQLGGGVYVEHAGADLGVDGDAEGLDLAAEARVLCGCDVGLAVEASLFEDRNFEDALGGEDAVVEAVCLAEDAVVAVDGERGNSLVLDGLAGAGGYFELGFEGEEIFAALVGDGLRVFEGELGEFGVGDGVGEGELLIRREAHEAVEGDLIFGEGILRLDEGLLLGLELDAGAEDVEVDADAGVVREGGLAEDLFVGGEQGLVVGDLGLVGEGGEVLRADRCYDSAADVEDVEGDDILSFFGGGVEVEVGEVEEGLVDD